MQFPNFAEFRRETAPLRAAPIDPQMQRSYPEVNRLTSGPWYTDSYCELLKTSLFTVISLAFVSWHGILTLTIPCEIWPRLRCDDMNVQMYQKTCSWHNKMKSSLTKTD